MIGLNLADFAAALTHADRSAPSGLTTWNGSDAGQRFAVYRNNVMVSLIEALATRFPVTATLVGSEFFRAMARFYCTDQPPRSVIMARYGDDFPEFIRSFAPAASLPYLSDVAALEALRTTAYHAADAVSLGPEAFAAFPLDRLSDLVLTFHPSLAILRSRYAIVALWSAHNGHGDLTEVVPDRPEDALVLRPDAEVLTLNLAPGTAEALTRLQQGQTLGAVVEAVSATCPEFDPVALFHLLLTSGAVSAMTLRGDAP